MSVPATGHEIRHSIALVAFVVVNVTCEYNNPRSHDLLLLLERAGRVLRIILLALWNHLDHLFAIRKGKRQQPFVLVTLSCQRSPCVPSVYDTRRSLSLQTGRSELVISLMPDHLLAKSLRQGQPSRTTRNHFSVSSTVVLSPVFSAVRVHP
jgi:hypothetical protein